MSITSPTLIQRQLIRDMRDRSRVVANLEMRLEGNDRRLSPSFSLTGEIYEAHGPAYTGKRRHQHYQNEVSTAAYEPDISGACHEELLRAFPELEQFAAMHLADPQTGEPMHAATNGWYWYAGSREGLARSDEFTGYNGQIYKWQLDKFGLRDDEAGWRSYCYLMACKTLRVQANRIPDDIATREEFEKFVDTQRERWAQEAAEAREFILSLPEEN